MEQPTLFILLGYPGSGKSYFAKRLAADIRAVRLNADSIRHHMFSDEGSRFSPASFPLVIGALDYATTAILTAGYSVISDSSHNKRRTRAKARQLAESAGARMVVVWVKTPLEIAKEREATRELTADQVRVKPEDFDRLVANLEEPRPDELSIVIDGQAAPEQQLAAFNEQLASL
jgi:predicted kinase